MTKEITKAFIIQEIQDKFKLREHTPEVFSFSEMVIPTYDISGHVQKWTAKVTTVSITSSGQKTFFTVPGTENWAIRRYDVIFMGAGGYTVAGVNVYRKIGGEYVYLDLAAAQSTSYHIDLIEPVFLEPGDIIGINVDGFVSTQSLRLIMDYRKDEIR